MYSSLSGFISSATSITLNLILFIISLKKTPTQMLDYSRIIRVHCIIDSIVSLKILLSLNHAVIINNNLYMISFSFLSNSFPSLTIRLLYSYTWGILFIISIVFIDFYYRYRTVCLQKTLSFAQLIGLFFIVFLFTAIISLPVYVYMKPGPHLNVEAETRELINFFDWQHKTDLPFFIVIAGKHPFTIFMLILMFLIIIFNYVIIIFTIRRINAVANESFKRRNSVTSKKAHFHIRRVLCIQASLPIIISIPVLYVLFQEVFTVNIVFLSDFSMILGMSYSPIKCLSTILAVPAYRNAFFEPLNFVCKKIGIFKQQDDKIVQISSQ